MDKGDDDYNTGRNTSASLVGAHGVVQYHVTRNDNAAVRNLLERNAINPNQQDEEGFALLHVACSCAGAAVLDTMLDLRGVDVCLRNSFGNTPLHYFCAKFNDVSAAQRLLQRFVEQGADLNVRNMRGETAVHKATINGAVGVLLVRELLAAGADPHLRNHVGESALFYALYLKQEQMVRELLAAGVRVDVEAMDGNTPIDLACEIGGAIGDAVCAVAEKQSLALSERNKRALKRAAERHAATLRNVADVADKFVSKPARRAPRAKSRSFTSDEVQ